MRMPYVPVLTPPGRHRARRRARMASAVTVVAALILAACATSRATGILSPVIRQSPSVSASPSIHVPSSPPPSATHKATTPPATHTPPPTGDACVAATLATMSLSQMAGQLIMVGTPVTNPTPVVATIRQYQLGGVFLAGRSKESASTLRHAIASLQSAAPGGIALQVALDQEGGEVQTLQGGDFPPIPTAVDQGKLDGPTLRSQTTAWASRLASIGVTMDLAPVADTVPTSIGTNNPPIGAFYREYGSDPTTVAADISVVVKAIQSTGVLTTLKHFPGLGRVLANTDTSTGAVDTVATTHDPYLAPFAAGIQAGTAVVMISSASYPNIDPNSIAAFSHPIVTGLLRQQLGFGGLIVSDDMGNAVAVKAVPVGQRAVRFVEAGGDVVLTVNTSDAGPMVAAIVAQAKASSAFAGQVRAAAQQVLRTKSHAGLLSCSA